jgi:hypothetical protein
MYRYDTIDQQLIDERVAQYRDQIARNLAGTLSDDELRPLRLQNGLYIQRHGPMLRIAIPYGQLSSAQLRKLADISRRYDRNSATSRRARTCSSTGRSSRRRRKSSANWRPSRCTPSRPPATASATSPPTSSPASRRTS